VRHRLQELSQAVLPNLAIREAVPPQREATRTYYRVALNREEDQARCILHVIAQLAIRVVGRGCEPTHFFDVDRVPKPEDGASILLGHRSADFNHAAERYDPPGDKANAREASAKLPVRPIGNLIVVTQASGRDSMSA